MAQTINLLGSEIISLVASNHNIDKEDLSVKMAPDIGGYEVVKTTKPLIVKFSYVENDEEKYDIFNEDGTVMEDPEEGFSPWIYNYKSVKYTSNGKKIHSGITLKMFFKDKDGKTQKALVSLPMTILEDTTEDEVVEWELELRSWVEDSQEDTLKDGRKGRKWTNPATGKVHEIPYGQISFRAHLKGEPYKEDDYKFKPKKRG